MAGIIGDLVSGKLRAEMKQRVDEILKCGEKWDETARELVKALDRLTDAIQKGNVDTSGVRSVARSSKKLSKETRNLAQAFINHRAFLQKIVERVG